MKKIRIAVLVLTIISLVIFCGFYNIFGGIGLILNEFEFSGTCFIISSVLLIAATVFACFEKIIVPTIMNIIGSGFYIYAISVLTLAKETAVSAKSAAIDNVLGNHYPSIIVTVLIFSLIFCNYFTAKNCEKRAKNKLEKYNKTERALTDDEKIM